MITPGVTTTTPGLRRSLRRSLQVAPSPLSVISALSSGKREAGVTEEDEKDETPPATSRRRYSSTKTTPAMRALSISDDSESTPQTKRSTRKGKTPKSVKFTQQTVSSGSAAAAAAAAADSPFLQYLLPTDTDPERMELENSLREDAEMPSQNKRDLKSEFDRHSYSAKKKHVLPSAATCRTPMSTGRRRSVRLNSQKKSSENSMTPNNTASIRRQRSSSRGQRFSNSSFDLQSENISLVEAFSPPLSTLSTPPPVLTPSDNLQNSPSTFNNLKIEITPGNDERRISLLPGIAPNPGVTATRMTTTVSAVQDLISFSPRTPRRSGRGKVTAAVSQGRRRSVRNTDHSPINDENLIQL
ncbi:uncharacterized protein LOC141900682 [Tubulanus polymorphus]|uniref:uncharacterized protein LOC141900682 n=1 Tax=Tubulanus polymorphus TaxID=672921 RepID=UPI003DA58139